jgi:hypothetical protein
MSDALNDEYIELLIQKAVSGLDETEQERFNQLDPEMAEMEVRSFELTAAAITTAATAADETLPSHLRSQILAGANRYFATSEIADSTADASVDRELVSRSRPDEDGTSRSWFGWLGWAVAAAACVALAINITLTRFLPDGEIAKNQVSTPQTPPPAPSLEQLHDQLAASPGAVKANWAPGNVKDIKGISGDLVWNEAKQEGYMKLRGLPVNDAKTCYQLWIFDKNQDKATPIDGGVFNVTREGDVVIPITAKIKAVGPEMFAITIEKEGGVVVSKREKIAALAKFETNSL